MVVLDVREVGHLVRLDADDDLVGNLPNLPWISPTRKQKEEGEECGMGGSIVGRTNPSALPPASLTEDVHVDPGPLSAADRTMTH